MKSHYIKPLLWGKTGYRSGWSLAEWHQNEKKPRQFVSDTIKTKANQTYLLEQLLTTKLFLLMICEKFTFYCWNITNKVISFLDLCFIYGFIFIRPSSDGTYYGMVMSVHPSVRPSGSPSVRPSQFSALFSYMLWHIDLKFCISLHFYARKIKFECHQFPSLFAGVMLLFNFKLIQICSFPHFSSYMLWHIEFKFCIWLGFNVPQSKFECRHFALIFVGVMPLCELRILEIHSFRTSLFHALTYWDEILHMTLFYCTTDQVRVSSICVNFCGSYAPFGT